MEPLPYLVTITVPGRVDQISFNRDVDTTLRDAALLTQRLRQATCACEIPKRCHFSPVRPESIIVDIIPEILVFEEGSIPPAYQQQFTDCEGCAESGCVSKVQILLGDNIEEGIDHYWSYLLLYLPITTVFLHSVNIPSYESRYRHSLLIDEVNWTDCISPDTSRDAAPSA